MEEIDRNRMRETISTLTSEMMQTQDIKLAKPTFKSTKKKAMGISVDKTNFNILKPRSPPKINKKATKLTLDLDMAPESDRNPKKWI
jgi:hypothetical protein